MAASAVWVYGRKSALKAVLSETRGTIDRTSGKTVGVMHTVSFQAGREHPPGARAGHVYNFDAGQVLTLQVSTREMSDVMATLCAWQSRCELKNHGPQKNKFLTLNHGPAGLALDMSGGGQGHFRFLLTGAKRLEILTLCFSQWRRWHGGLSGEVLFAMLEACYRAPTPPAGSDEMRAVLAQRSE